MHAYVCVSAHLPSISFVSVVSNHKGGYHNLRCNILQLLTELVHILCQPLVPKTWTPPQLTRCHTMKHINQIAQDNMHPSELEATGSFRDPNLRVVNALLLQPQLVVQDVLEVELLQPSGDEGPPPHVQDACHPLAGCLGLQDQCI